MNPININNIVTNREFLVENEKFKTLFFKFEDGKGLPNHSHNGYATIQVVGGTVDIEFKDGEKIEQKEGDFLPFDARIEHNVIAKEVSKVLVTIAKAPMIKNLKR